MVSNEKVESIVLGGATEQSAERARESIASSATDVITLVGDAFSLAGDVAGIVCQGAVNGACAIGEIFSGL